MGFSAQRTSSIPLLKLCHTAEEKLWIQGSLSKWELYMLFSSVIRALVWKGWIFLTCASSAALVPVPSTSNVSVKMNIALTLVFVQEFGAENAACPEHSWGWAFHKRQAERRLLDITSRKANLNMHMGTEEWAYSGEPCLKAVVKLLTSISACSSLSFFSLFTFLGKSEDGIVKSNSLQGIRQGKHGVWF